MSHFQMLHHRMYFLSLLFIFSFHFSGICQNTLYVRIDDRDCPNCNLPISYCKKISSKYEKILVFRSSACRFSEQLARQYLDKPYKIICSDSLFNLFGDGIGSMIRVNSGSLSIKYSVKSLNSSVLEKINQLPDRLDFSEVILPDTLSNRIILACNGKQLWIIDELFNVLYNYNIEKKRFEICRYFIDNKKELFRQVFGSDSNYTALTTNELILKHQLSTDIHVIAAFNTHESIYFIANFYKLIQIQDTQPHIMLTPILGMIQNTTDKKFNFVNSDFTGSGFSAGNDSIFIFSDIYSDTLLSIPDSIVFTVNSIQNQHRLIKKSSIAFPLNEVYDTSEIGVRNIFAYPYALNAGTFELYDILHKEYLGSVRSDFKQLNNENFFDQEAYAMSLKENYLRILFRNKQNEFKIIYFHTQTREVEKVIDLKLHFVAGSNFCTLFDTYFLGITDGLKLLNIKIPDIKE